MPELPDVELYKRHLDATCLGRTIRDFVVGDTRVLADMSSVLLPVTKRHQVRKCLRAVVLRLTSLSSGAIKRH